MGKLEEILNKQLKIPERKEDAEACIKILNGLKDLDNGNVWSIKWQILVEVEFKGFPYSDKYYYPSKIGNIFLKGLTK